MKRSFAIGILCLVGVGVVYLASCSEPLDVNNSPSNNPPARVDTVYVFDTLTPSDTSVRIDTISIHDTIRLTDTVHQMDTVRQIDTTIRFDTITIIDPHYIHDTVSLVDTMTVIDTTTVVDTLVRTDTVTNYDTVTVTHTVIQHDTVRVTETTTVVDTLVHVDTVQVVDSVDCNFEPVCASISPYNGGLVWLFRNQEGTYHLELNGYTRKDEQLQTVIININGKDYYWKADQNSAWVKDLTLPANTIIKLKLSSSTACGTGMSVCVSMTRL